MAAKPKRPPRRRKGDRLLYSGAARADVECDYAIGPLDRLAQEMDQKWGIDRLPELVSAETAAKYGSAMAKLNAALAKQDPAEAVQRANVCCRGLVAMDAEAERLGHKPNPGTFWEFQIDDFHIGIMKDDTAWQTAKAARPDLTLFTLRDATLALRAYSSATPIEEVKSLFPGAEIVSLPQMSGAKSMAQQLDDEIPW